MYSDGIHSEASTAIVSFYGIGDNLLNAVCVCVCVSVGWLDGVSESMFECKAIVKSI